MNAKKKCNMKPMTRWKLVTDSFGYASGIAYRGKTILHLNTGTVRNVEYGQKFINMLNEKCPYFHIRKKSNLRRMLA